jgi:hypothetical protein
LKKNCPFCDKEEKPIDHLLISCAFSRQYWFFFLGRISLQEISPQPEDTSFFDWWVKSNAITTRGGSKERTKFSHHFGSLGLVKA